MKTNRDDRAAHEAGLQALGALGRAGGAELDAGRARGERARLLGAWEGRGARRGHGWRLGAGAVALGTLALVLVLGRGRPVDYAIEEAGETPERRAASGETSRVAEPSGLDGRARGTVLRFSDGTRAELRPRSRTRVAETTARGARLVVDDGGVRLDVAPRPGARWSVEAGGYVVRVTGTIFEVTWDRARGLFEATLHHGSVEVSGPGVVHGVRLSAGQVLRARGGVVQIGAFDGPGAAPHTGAAAGLGSAPAAATNRGFGQTSPGEEEASDGSAGGVPLATPEGGGARAGSAPLDESASAAEAPPPGEAAPAAAPKLHPSPRSEPRPLTGSAAPAAVERRAPEGRAREEAAPSGRLDRPDEDHADAEQTTNAWRADPAQATPLALAPRAQESTLSPAPPVAPPAPAPTGAASASVAAPPLEPAPAELAPVTAPAEARAWADRLAAGDARGVVAAARAGGLARALATRDLPELVALADAGRYAGDAGVARHALEAVRARFPKATASARAAFLLGRLLDDAGARGPAAEHYRLYLDEAPAGALREEALGRQMLARAASGERAAARALAEDYLTAFPRGAFAEQAAHLREGP